MTYGKGVFTWTKDDLQLKFSGTTQDRTFVQGKFEAKQGSKVVSTIEGLFNVPFPNSNDEPLSDPLEETKEHVEIPAMVNPEEKAKAKLELPPKQETNLKN